MEHDILSITPEVKLINLQVPIPGYNKFIGPYLISGEKVAVIDVGPATAIPSFLSSLRQLNVNPEDISYVIFTHIHIDHAGSAGGLARELPNAKFIAHPRAHEHLVDPDTLWKASLKVLGDYAVMSGQIDPVPENRLIDAEDGMKLDLGHKINLDMHFTPGHAIHHICLLYQSAGVLFVGEAAGVCINGSVRLATPPPFKLDITLSSIGKLIKLNPERLCYSHFGCYDQGVKRLQLYRKKVMQWYKVVNFEARKGKCPEDIFRALREIDGDLNYLDGLNSDIYLREVSLILNSIRGLAGYNVNSRKGP